MIYKYHAAGFPSYNSQNGLLVLGLLGLRVQRLHYYCSTMHGGLRTADKACSRLLTIGAVALQVMVLRHI